jgi:hypothetical protein
MDLLVCLAASKSLAENRPVRVERPASAATQKTR